MHHPLLGKPLSRNDANTLRRLLITSSLALLRVCLLHSWRLVDQTRDTIYGVKVSPDQTIVTFTFQEKLREHEDKDNVLKR